MRTKHHGRESLEHRALKHALALRYRALGFPFVVTEQNYCDVVAARIERGKLFTHCIEVERSAKNALRNVRRNLSLRCDQVVVVCVGAPVERAIRRMLNSLTPHERSRVQITTAAEFNERKYDPISTINGGSLGAG
jgi:hypothetical protein